MTDQLLRWRTGRPKGVGDYLAEHPSLADDPEAILKLVQGEFLARLERGEAPDTDSYARMFPASGRGDPPPVRGGPMADDAVPAGPRIVDGHDRGLDRARRRRDG